MELIPAIMINDWFDKYSLQARLAPALLTLFPAILLLAIEFPHLYQTAAGLVSLVLICGVLTLVSHFARTRGKKVEQRLNTKWGGRPTTRFLLNANGELDDRTYNRYLTFFSQKIPNWGLGENKREDLESAVRWLLERTRDTATYGLVFKENISYGFRRNCLGMKPVGLFIVILCSVYWLLQIQAEYTSLHEVLPLHMGGLGIAILLLLWWMFVVGDDWVQEAGNAYAKTLLGSIDTMNE